MRACRQGKAPLPSSSRHSPFREGDPPYRRASSECRRRELHSVPKAFPCRQLFLLWITETALVTVSTGEKSWLMSWTSLLGWLAAALPK